VCRLGFGVTVHFDQHEAGGVGLLLRDVEAGDARLLDALPGIGERCLLEGFDTIRLYTDVNMNDEHAVPFVSVFLPQESIILCSLARIFSSVTSAARNNETASRTNIQ
jgi:hypothetical protein